jgi:hypothetical protein
MLSGRSGSLLLCSPPLREMADLRSQFSLFEISLELGEAGGKGLRVSV